MVPGLAKFQVVWSLDFSSPLTYFTVLYLFFSLFFPSRTMSMLNQILRRIPTVSQHVETVKTIPQQLKLKLELLASLWYNSVNYSMVNL